MENDPAAMGKIQKVAVTIHERFKVAICLCLIPKNRARSLSTPVLTSSVERLANTTNKESGCCQTTIQEFERRMKQKFLV